MAYSLSGERPSAARFWPLRMLASAAGLVRAARKARRQRLALAALMEMDDYHLWDVGISRADLNRALRDDGFDADRIHLDRRSEFWPPA